jgi:hypothetical protein
VQLNFYSALGQLEKSIPLGEMNAGQQETILDAQFLKPGMYILQLNTGTGVYSRKVSVIR